jgi:ubiquinol-cytochrome c reductase cytochrome c1 subunit
MKPARFLLLLLLALPIVAGASEGVRLDHAPINERDLVSLQRGAQVYVNYCLGCHSAAYMRYNRLTDLGLTEQQIKSFLILGDAKVGELMKIAMDPRSAREWFGAAPPDLTVIARSRSSEDGSGGDWVYTYLRSFYRDASRPTGWNNLVYPNVAMPHVLYQLQGQQVLEVHESEGPGGHKHKEQSLKLEKPGAMSPLEYDRMVADLVNFLVYMGEPAKHSRVAIGIFVLIFLFVLLVLAYALKKEFWKNVH